MISALTQVLTVASPGLYHQPILVSFIYLCFCIRCSIALDQLVESDMHSHSVIQGNTELVY